MLSGAGSTFGAAALIALIAVLSLLIRRSLGPLAGWTAIAVVALLNLPIWLGFLAVLLGSGGTAPIDPAYLPPTGTTPGTGWGAMGYQAFGAGLFTLATLIAAFAGMGLGARLQARSRP